MGDLLLNGERLILRKNRIGIFIEDHLGCQHSVGDFLFLLCFVSSVVTQIHSLFRVRLVLGAGAGGSVVRPTAANSGP